MGSKWKDNFVKIFKDYCDNTTLHGYKYLALPNRKIYERFIWVTVIIAAIVATIILFQILLTDYYKSPTVTTMESSKYPIQNVPFPGVAICNVNKISRKYAMNLALELNDVTNYSLETIFDTVRYFGRLYDFEVEDIEKVNLLDKILDESNILKDKPDELLKILQNLSPQCNDTIIKCFWEGIERNCTDILLFRRTMDGFCCSFNYVKTLANIETLSSNTKADNNSTKIKETFTPNAGLGMGLTLVVNDNIDDYYYPLLSAEGLSVKIFNSFDYPDSSSGGLSECFFPLAHEVFMQISATTVQAMPALHETSKDSRECIFGNEASTAFDNSYYSYSDCLAECKMRSILAICECIPFFMPVLRTFKFSKQLCTLSDITCLNKYQEKWINVYPDTDREELEFEKENSVHCPQCIPSCDYVAYSVATNYAYLVETNKPNDLVKGLNLSQHSVVHVFFATEYSTLYTTDLFYYWFDIISNFGGICSLFLGFSLISVTELIYFFTIRYFRLFETIQTKEFIH